MSSTTPTAGIRKPTMRDVPGIKALIDSAAGRGALLQRTLAEIYETMRDFFVYEHEGQVAGCCALHVDMADLAEIRSVVVRSELRGKHIGEALVQAVIDEARALDIGRIYALTRVEGFFLKQGFVEIDKHDLPSKVFRDCVRCPLFPDCDEVAVALDVDDDKGQTGETTEKE